MEGNPFGAPSQQQPNMAGNPFASMAGAASPSHQAGYQQQQQPSHGGYGKDPSYMQGGGGDNPFGQPQQHVAGGYSAYPAHQQQQQQQQQMMMGAAVSYDGAMVPSMQPTNPYAVSAHDVFGQQQQQAIVPAAHQTNQWAMPASPAPAAFDPFAAPPAVTPTPQYQQQQQQHDVFPMQDDIFGEEIPQGQEQQLQQQPPASPTSPLDDSPLYSNDDSRPDPPHTHEQDDDEDYYNRDRARAAADPPSSPRQHQNQYGHSSSGNQYGHVIASSSSENVSAAAAAAEVQRNRYSQELSRRAPPGASPLPKSELVRKKGFVLSRISFRTIVMKKWKQSFWVQYGPHTMLWFRSQTDFDDWLNNPYHTQSQRNFLIKLAVNFVHDLYKPSVRGYQVTQCRTKAYGAKMIRQFKLERWMDYGPTIAAAFGSYNPKEVDDLREALVECMRNTPLNGGIRATGAVRQQNSNPNQQQQRQQHHHHQHDTTDADNYGMHTHPPPGREQERQQKQQEGGGDAAAAQLGSGDSALEEVADKDLLDMDDWDAVPSATSTSGGSPPQPGYAPQQQQPGYAPQQHLHAVYGGAPGYPPQQQQGQYPPPQQQQAAGYGNTMVPVGAAPQAYGATPGWLQEQQQPAYGAPASPQQQQRQYQEY